MNLIFNHVHVHDDEDVTTENPKIDQIPNNKAHEKIEDKKGSQLNDVPRVWRILHDHFMII